MVVNNKSVGKYDISSTSFTNKTLNRIIRATERLNASITSSKPEGIGTIKKITAQSR